MWVWSVLCVNKEISLRSNQSNYIRSYTGFRWFSTDSGYPAILSAADKQSIGVVPGWTHSGSAPASVLQSQSVNLKMWKCLWVIELLQTSTPAFVIVWLHRQRFHFIFISVTFTELHHPKVKVSKFTSKWNLFLKNVLFEVKGWLLFLNMHCANGVLILNSTYRDYLWPHSYNRLTFFRGNAYSKRWESQKSIFSILNRIISCLFNQCFYYTDVLLWNIGCHFVFCAHVILQVLL